MQSNFQKALDFTLKYEGGYVNNPHDHGGATNFGITQDTYDEYLEPQESSDVKYISQDEVRQIYRSMYWDAVGADALPDGLDIAAFDLAVNSGVARAKKYLGITQDVKEFLDLREKFFRTIGVGDQSIFLKGWLNRVNALRAYLGV